LGGSVVEGKEHYSAVIGHVVNPKSFTEIGQIEALINEGERLQQSPRSNNILQASSDSGLAIPVTTLIDRWVEKSINFTVIP
jgi:hypothetical protein